LLAAIERAGKTVTACIKAIQLISVNELPVIMAEPTHGMIKRVLIPCMDELLYKLNLKFELNKSDGYYNIWINGIQKRIWLLSAENYTRVAGISASAFIIDEIDLLNKETAIAAWNMFTSRLTRGKQMQGIATSTPEGFNFLYEFFVENAGPDRKLIRASTYDNPFIDDSYIENLRNTHSEQQLEAYLNGHFINLVRGQVYYAFDRKIHDTKETDSRTHILHIGMDFNVDNGAASICQIKNNIIYVIDEISGTRNTEDMIIKIKERYPNRQIIIYPDAAGNQRHTSASFSDIALLKKAGFEVKYNSKNPYIKDRVASVNARFRNAKNEIHCYVNTSVCKLLTKSLEQQGYNNGVPDKSTGLDHQIDSLGYVIHYLYPITGRSSIRQF